MTRDEAFKWFTGKHPVWAPLPPSSNWGRMVFEAGAQQGTREMREWIPISSRPPEACRMVLTQHIEDIYPVPAYFVTDYDGSTHWMLGREGPEDTHDGRPGKDEPLYRAPTHWQELPEGPRATLDRD